MKDLFKKFGAFSVGPMLNAVIGFFTVMITTYFITPEEYGKTSMFLLAQSAISMFVYLGLDQAFVRNFHSYRDKVGHLFYNALIIPAIGVIVVDFCILLNIHWVSNYLFNNSDEIFAVIVLALLIPFMVIENFAFLKIRMEEKGLEYSFFYVLVRVLVLILTLVLFFVYERSFRSVVYAMGFAEIINGILLSIRVMPSLEINYRLIDKPLIAEMLKFGLPLIPAYMITWVLTSMDKMMLRSISDFTQLGLYGAAFKIVTILGIIQTCFTLFWTPVAYRWYEEGANPNRFRDISKFVAFLMTGMCMGLLLFKDLVVLILGKSFGETIHIFPFLLLSPIMYTISETTGVGIGLVKKTSYNIVSSLVAALINVVLNYTLIPIYGGIGAAIGTGISYIGFFWARTLIANKIWQTFNLLPYAAYSVLIILNCYLHTFLDGYIPYVVSAISILIILIINLHSIKQWIKLLKVAR